MISSCSRACAALLVAAGLCGCQSLGNVIGGNSGVMPNSDVGPPPSMRGEIKQRTIEFTNVDEDGNPLPSSPTRQIVLPKSAGGTARTAEATSSRRIRRDELDGGNAAGGGGGPNGSGVAPSMTQSGGVGLGGKF